jgi:PHD/YefM family antitoxin component YafN of YafNO toxin-antitoxin module
MSNTLTDTTITPTPTPVVVITSEEQFRDLSSALASNIKSTHQQDRFDELARYVHESLKIQDSDKALILITR